MIYYTEFMPKRLQDAGVFKAIDWVMVRMDFPENVHVVLEWKRLSGYVHGTVLDQDYEPGDTERWFEIELHNQLGKNNTLRAIFHEMAHIKQYCDGRLRYENGEPLWLGKPMPGLLYDQRPWELDAFEREEQLFQEYKVFVYKNAEKV